MTPPHHGRWQEPRGSQRRSRSVPPRPEWFDREEARVSRGVSCNLQVYLEMDQGKNLFEKSSFVFDLKFINHQTVPVRSF